MYECCLVGRCDNPLGCPSEFLFPIFCAVLSTSHWCWCHTESSHVQLLITMKLLQWEHKKRMLTDDTYEACAFHGKLKLSKHTRYMYFMLLFYAIQSSDLCFSSYMFLEAGPVSNTSIRILTNFLVRTKLSCEAIEASEKCIVWTIYSVPAGLA